MDSEAPMGWIFGGVILLVAIVVLSMWGCPQYGVYSMRQDGEAELAKAQYSRQTAVAEAKAKQEAAVALAAADTLRAMGVARSNQIIGQSLRDNPDYLKWLWVENLKEKNGNIIYVPTETNLPILEAHRTPQTPGEK